MIAILNSLDHAYLLFTLVAKQSLFLESEGAYVYEIQVACLIDLFIVRFEELMVS